jgi:hypothetical protein
LRTASGIYARRGYRGTTTRETAERAGINEIAVSSLCWQGAALLAIIDEQWRVRPPPQARPQPGAGRKRLGSFSPPSPCEFLNRTTRDAELTRRLWFTALENHKLAQRFLRTFMALFRQDGYSLTIEETWTVCCPCFSPNRLDPPIAG